MELAHLAWTSVPLFRDLGAAEAARRLGILAAAYGTCSAREVLDAVPRRVRASVDAIRAAQERRDEGFLRLATVGEPQRTQRWLADHLERAPLIEKELS
jgi:hypothetical protein